MLSLSANASMSSKRAGAAKKKSGMRDILGTEPRATHEEGFKAGLLALRAQGLEPSDFAKDLAAKVIAGTITSQEMEDALNEHYRSRAAAKGTDHNR